MIPEIEIQEINRNEFDRNYSVIGNPDGNYEEVIQFLKWALESKNTDNGEHIKQAIQILSDGFGKEITTKFLKNIVGNIKNKNQRITYLVKKAGLKYLRINRYYSEMVSSISQRKQMTYSIKNKTFTMNEISMTIGNYYNAHKKEGLKKIISTKEFEKRQKRLKEMIEEAQQKKRVIQKTEEKEEVKEEKYIKVNCSKCNEIIKIPLTPNMDKDKYEKFAYNIYNSVINDINKGIYFCQSCKEDFKSGFSNGWMEGKIIEFIKGLKGVVRFSSKDFCDNFRIDKKNVGVGYVKNKISELCPTVKVKQEEDKIKIKSC